jgi:predicted unusual protein kinase regulating ubiquinone biosynthesis (AarF/ABC1/UbiB family)
MIPQIAGLDRAMDELVGTAMAQIQEMINEKLSANMPDEAEEEAPREEAPIWQQSFDRLVGGALTDSSCGYGKFMNGVLSSYFQNASPQEGRQMLASIFRNTTAESTQGQIVGALFKGAGPLLQKMLQALPADAFGDDMRDALKDMKSNLQPIPEAIVKSHLLDIVNRSAGAIKSIEVVRSLGAASVGQAFLCRMITAEHPTGEEVVVKILRPNVKTIIENERRRFTEAAKSAPGMEKTFEGQYARILEELDFTKEKTNIDFGRSVYEQPTMIYTDGFSGKDRRVVTLNTLHSMEVHPLVPPSMDSLILKKAPGETYDRYMADAREKAREIAGVANPQGHYEFADPGSMTEAKVKLLKLYNEVKTRQDYLLQLTEKWVQEALYGNGFYHGDLHAGNIMTDGRGLTVIDFGNATHLTKAEREHVLKMMSAAMFGREAYFEESFKALISEEGRAVYDARNANGEITKALHEILNKGVTTDTGRRIFAALMHLQRHGIEIPGPIYNFAQCQMRLGGAVDEMSSLLNEIRYSVEQIRLAPIDVPQIPQDAPSVAEGVRAAFNVLIGVVNSEGGGYDALAANLKPHFGITGVSYNDTFEKDRRPQFIAELKTAFRDRETFDRCLKPVLEYLCGAKNCSVSGDAHHIETDATSGVALREKLAEFISVRDGGDEGVVE